LRTRRTDKTLPPEYLNRLLADLEKIVPADQDLRDAAIDDMFQTYLNDKAIADVLEMPSGSGSTPT
jgi:hypothetical protein